MFEVPKKDRNKQLRKRKLDETNNNIYDTSIDSQGICEDTKIVGAPNVLDEIDLEKNTFNNKPFDLTIKEDKIAEGSYGEIKEITINKTSKKLGIKIPK